MEPKKYIVSGYYDGKLGDLISKICFLNEKNGPFGAAFIMGGSPVEESDVSALFNLIKEEFSSPFPYYFVSGPVKLGLLEDGLIEELERRNVHFTRPFGVMKTGDGLRFAFVSGSDVPSKGPSDYVTISKDSLEYVEEQYMVSAENEDDEGIIDVLFSWSIPEQIQGLESCPSLSSKMGGLIWRLKPRYIFCPTQSPHVFHERAPFENVNLRSGDFLHPTRFVALANCFNEEGKKWIYAINIIPSKSITPLSLASRPEGCTSNPFDPLVAAKIPTAAAAEGAVRIAPNYFFQVTGDLARRGIKRQAPTEVKRPREGYVCKKCRSSEHYFRDCPFQDSKYQSPLESTYVCHICHEPGHHIRSCPKKDELNSKVPKTDKLNPEACWFCLSNPAARRHLIVDIGEEVYLTLAKGPLTPEHVIIIPIEHLPVNFSESSVNKSLSAEIDSYMQKVNSLCPGKCSIFFQISNNPTHHFHIQSISIPSEKFDQFIEFLKHHSEEHGYKFGEASVDINRDDSSFCFSYFDKSGQLRRLVHHFTPGSFFPAQYGRQVVASFLDLQEQSDWKSQTYSEDAEKQFVSILKEKL